MVRWTFRLTLGAVALAVFWVLVYREMDPPGGPYMWSESLRLGGVEHEWQPLREISPRLARAVIAAEDANYCAHSGFDFEAIRNAMEANREGRRVVGASTITQQVAKNVFLWHERSWLRKGLEAGFTVLIEALWTKRRIMEVYVNSVEFAPGVFGAEAASWHHFGRPSSALTNDQAARLAAVLPAPKTRSAGHPSRYIKRRARVIAAGAATIEAEGRDSCVFD